MLYDNHIAQIDMDIFAVNKLIQLRAWTNGDFLSSIWPMGTDISEYWFSLGRPSLETTFQNVVWKMVQLIYSVVGLVCDSESQQYHAIW